MVRAHNTRIGRLLHHPLPAPAALRQGPWRRGTFTSVIRSPRLTSHLGLLLGLAFAICFATGLLSHLIQHPPQWFFWPARPVWFYRARWYALMPFGFIAAHYWTAWLTIGALFVHIAVKLPLVRRSLAQRPRPSTVDHPGLSRRGLLAAVGGTVAVVTLSTLGQTVRPLSRGSVLGPRRPDIGPQGLPVNTSGVAEGWNAD